MESSEANIGVAPGRSVAGAVRRQPLAAVGIALLAVFVLCAVFAPWLAPQESGAVEPDGQADGAFGSALVWDG